MDDLGFSEDTRQTTGLSGSLCSSQRSLRQWRVHMGQHNLGGSTTTGIGAHTLDHLQHYFWKLQKDLVIKSFWKKLIKNGLITSLMLATKVSWRFSDDQMEGTVRFSAII